MELKCGIPPVAAGSSCHPSTGAVLLDKVRTMPQGKAWSHAIWVWPKAQSKGKVISVRQVLVELPPWLIR